MDPIRRLSCWTICLFVLISASSLSPTAATTSLWGKKLQFKGAPCLWQLRSGAEVPALDELSACILVRRALPTKWTGFVYKAPGQREAELGLAGSGDQLTVWLLGEQLHFRLNAALKEWHRICITWSGRSRRLKVYANGTSLDEARVDGVPDRPLGPNGTLTVGVSHFSVDGEVKAESGTDLMGDIGLFRVWGREMSALELQSLSCADGDVVSWGRDLRQSKYVCPAQPDSNLQCSWSRFKIEMQTFILHPTNPAKCVMSLEEITRKWLTNTFPSSMSVQDILVSSPSHSCHMADDPTPLQGQQSQDSETTLNAACDKCFSLEVFVNVVPAAPVEHVQAVVTTQLSLTFSSQYVNMTADPGTVSVLPVELSASEFPPTLDTPVTLPEKNPTQGLSAKPTKSSTTKEPLDLNETAIAPDTFFRVNLTLSLSGSSPNPEALIRRWLENRLESNKTMTVLNTVIEDISDRNVEEHGGTMTPSGPQKQFYCTFHVQEYNQMDVAEALATINASLTSQSANDSVTIEAQDVAIKHIVPENCLEETLSTAYGQYIWPESYPQVNQEMICRKPKTRRAYRLCKLDIETDTARWAEPNMSECKLLVTISDLDNVTVTTGNAAEVVDVIQDLVDAELSSSDELSPSDLVSVVTKLNEVVDKSVVKPAVGADIVSVIADILTSKTDVTPVSNTILNLTESMGHRMDVEGESEGVTAPSLALSMINVERDDFSGLTFGVSSVSSTLDPKIFVNQSFVGGALPETVASISLPSELHQFFNPGVRNKTRVHFEFYATHELFQEPVAQSRWRLSSYIVSASINNSRVIGLPAEDRVVVTLSHQPPEQPEDTVRCMFWDFRKNGGQGGWNSSGCETRSISPSQTSCLCDHLTHFAVLLDVSRGEISKTDTQILTVISYLGCGISSIFLSFTLLTYLLFEKLRRDYPSKILINLSAALLGLSMLFLVDSWLSAFSNYGLCIATAATLHYFLLASFTWMGLEAVHMYLALVKVFNTYFPSYILKFCAIGWGVPLVIVSLVLAIDKDAYGNVVSQEAGVVLQSTDPFCWVQNEVFLYVTVVAFILLVLLCNMFVFTVVLIQIRRTRANKPLDNGQNALRDLRAVASLTVLLGLTWSMGLFSFGPGRVVLMYLFVIFNSLQGFFLFLFHCLMKENVRKQWRIHLCCGRFKLNDSSDWSRTLTVGGRGKKNNLINSESLASDNTTSVRSSTGSSPSLQYHQGA